MVIDVFDACGAASYTVDSFAGSCRWSRSASVPNAGWAPASKSHDVWPETYRSGMCMSRNMPILVPSFLVVTSQLHGAFVSRRIFSWLVVSFRRYHVSSCSRVHRALGASCGERTRPHFIRLSNRQTPHRRRASHEQSIAALHRCVRYAPPSLRSLHRRSTFLAGEPALTTSHGLPRKAHDTTRPPQAACPPTYLPAP